MVTVIMSVHNVLVTQCINACNCTAIVIEFQLLSKAIHLEPLTRIRKAAALKQPATLVSND